MKAMTAMQGFVVGWIGLGISACGDSHCDTLTPCPHEVLVSSACEIVSFTTTCVANVVSCQHTRCAIQRPANEACSITIKLADGSTSTANLRVTVSDCGCAFYNADSFALASSVCSNPDASTDATGD